jgi:hypothetical protein
MFSSGVFPKFRNWLQDRLRRNSAPPVQLPLIKLRGLVVALAAREKKPLDAIKMTIESVGPDRFQCKVHELLEEGERLSLELRHGDQQLAVAVVVDWINLSPVAHTVAVRLMHTKNTQLRWREFIGYLEKHNLLMA